MLTGLKSLVRFILAVRLESCADPAVHHSFCGVPSNSTTLCGAEGVCSTKAVSLGFDGNPSDAGVNARPTGAELGRPAVP